MALNVSRMATDMATKWVAKTHSGLGVSPSAAQMLIVNAMCEAFCDAIVAEITANAEVNVSTPNGTIGISTLAGTGNVS